MIQGDTLTWIKHVRSSRMLTKKARQKTQEPKNCRIEKHGRQRVN